MSPTFRALHNRNYRLYAMGGVVSNTGTWMQRVAQDWLVLQLHHGSAASASTALGITTGLQFLPILLLSPYAGLVADRFPKRRLLQMTQAWLGLSGLLLGVLAVTGVVEPWMVYTVAFTFGVGAAFDAPARQAFVSEMVDRDDLSNAVGLNSASFNLARVVGPALSGFLIAALGSGVRATGLVILVNAVSYLAGVAGPVVAGAMAGLTGVLERLRRLGPVALWHRRRGQRGQRPTDASRLGRPGRARAASSRCHPSPASQGGPVGLSPPSGSSAGPPGWYCGSAACRARWRLMLVASSAGSADDPPGSHVSSPYAPSVPGALWRLILRLRPGNRPAHRRGSLWPARYPVLPAGQRRRGLVHHRTPCARPAPALAQGIVGDGGGETLVHQPHRQWREPGRERTGERPGLRRCRAATSVQRGEEQGRRIGVSLSMTKTASLFTSQPIVPPRAVK